MTLKNSMFTVMGGTPDQVAVRLNGGHEIYKAHFPGNPITPGVCIVQMIGELLSDRCGRRLSLSKIVNLKFVAPISFTLVDDTATACKGKGTITSGEQLLTQFSLVFNG